jgi:hypothetical protein
VASQSATERRIISIASAPGWGALYANSDDPDEETRVVTLAAWALVETPEGVRQLVGLVQTSKGGTGPTGPFDFSDEVDGFAGYTNQGLKTKRAE